MKLVLEGQSQAATRRPARKSLVVLIALLLGLTVLVLGAVASAPSVASAQSDGRGGGASKDEEHNRHGKDF